MYDFMQFAVGKAVPYGIYDMKLNEGYVNVGIDHDTAEFAVQSIRKWWNSMEKKRYPDAKKLLITADGGGSNSSRVRLWKIELQKLATETGLEISVCHFPPGTRKWNKIEHRLFSFITKNWGGKPLVSFEVIVNLIANTRTEKGGRVECSIDRESYEKGIRISSEEMSKLNIKTDEFHGEWNYTIASKCKCRSGFLQNRRCKSDPPPITFHPLFSPLLSVGKEFFLLSFSLYDSPFIFMTVQWCSILSRTAEAIDRIDALTERKMASMRSRAAKPPQIPRIEDRMNDLRMVQNDRRKRIGTEGKLNKVDAIT